MKRMLRYLDKVLMIVFTIGMVLSACSKADPETDFEFEPSEDSKGMVITDYNGNKVNVVVPAKIQKLPVVGLMSAFAHTNIISVQIPKSVTEIESAFYGCSNLTSINIPAGVTIIGYGAFKDCSKLTSIIIPANVKEIGPSAFEGCSKLTSIIIPANIKEIGKSAFENCIELASVTFKGTDVTIGIEAFNYCQNLEKLEFSENALKPYKHSNSLIRDIRKDNGKIVTENYSYSFSYNWRGEKEQNFRFVSGANAFDRCDKLPPETITKLSAMGFLSSGEIRELEQRAWRGEL